MSIVDAVDGASSHTDGLSLLAVGAADDARLFADGDDPTSPGPNAAVVPVMSTLLGLLELMAPLESMPLPSTDVMATTASTPTGVSPRAGDVRPSVPSPLADVVLEGGESGNKETKESEDAVRLPGQ